MSARFTKLQDTARALAHTPEAMLLIGSIVLFIFSAWLWWAKVYTSPHRVFWGMLDNNLTTTAVHDHHITKEINGLKIDKNSDLTFGKDNTVHITATTIATASKTTVKTETIATPTDQYDRYTGIMTTQTGHDGKPFDVKPIINKWSKTATPSTAFNQTVLRPYSFPQANLTSKDRDALLKFLHDNVVFDTKYTVKKSTIQGRPRYTYNVNIQPVAYLAFVKTFAADLGMKDLDSIDPAQAQGTPPIPLTVTVDVWSHRLVSVTYPGQGYTESYSDYNLPHVAPLPKATISTQQLQQLVSQLQ